MSAWAPLALAAFAVPAALVVQPLADDDVLEPSVRNEVDRALAVAPTNPPPCALAAPFGTNAMSATALAVRLVSSQRADGRWLVGTNDATAAAVELLRAL